MISPQKGRIIRSSFQDILKLLRFFAVLFMYFPFRRHTERVSIYSTNTLS
jgi:hypothetical protein